MAHAGRSVIVSGSTVAVGLLSMILLPLPFIRSIGIGGMLIPAVSVIAAITLLPAMLSLLGPRINSVRVMPKRIVEAPNRRRASGTAGRDRHRAGRFRCASSAWSSSASSLVLGFQLNPSEAQARTSRATGDAIAGRAALGNAGISPGVLKPFEILARRRDAGPGRAGVAGDRASPAQRRRRPGRRTASRSSRRFPAHDGASKDVRGRSISNHRTRCPDRLRDARRRRAGGPRLRARGLRQLPVRPALRRRAHVHAARARVQVAAAPLKAVILNLVSLGAAYGIIVFIFQQGHGSEAIWGVPATQSIIPWIPLMIFAFLYGLSMDYEVFMLTRMREAYDRRRAREKRSRSVSRARGSSSRAPRSS